MSTSLFDLWLDGNPAIAVRDADALVAVLEATRTRGEEAGLPAAFCEAAATAAAQLAHDQLATASEGFIAVTRIERAGTPGIEIRAVDDGDGLATGTTISMYELVHETDVDLRRGEGRCIRARVFASPLPRSEVAIIARAGEADPVCGDHAALDRRASLLRVSACDGLGRGLYARASADRAIETVMANPTRPLPEVIAAVDEATATMRGVALGVVEIDLVGGRLVHASVGSVSARVFRTDGNGYLMRAFAGVLGAQATARGIPVETIVFEPGDVVVLATDGLASPLTIGRYLGREPALAIAQELMLQYGRAADDAVVAVIR